MAAARISDGSPYSVTQYVRTEVYSMTFTSPDWSFVDLDAVDGPNYGITNVYMMDLTTR